MFSSIIPLSQMGGQGSGGGWVGDGVLCSIYPFNKHQYGIIMVVIIDRAS